MASEVTLPASLFAIDDRRFALRMAEQAAMWIAGALAVASHNTPAVLAGVLLLALVYARNLEFVHECIHSTALRARRANRIAGTLLAIPMLVSFTRWRREHAQHHRDVRIEGFRYAYERLTTKRELFLHLFMVRHFAAAIVSLEAPMIAALAGTAALAIALHSTLPLVLWFAPLPIAAIIHTIIELPEHLGLESAGSDAFENSRVIEAGALVTWLVNGNNFHAVHHWNARIPQTRLAQAYAALGTRSTASYAAFYRRFCAGIFNRRFVPADAACDLSKDLHLRVRFVFLEIDERAVREDQCPRHDEGPQVVDVW